MIIASSPPVKRAQTAPHRHRGSETPRSQSFGLNINKFIGETFINMFFYLKANVKKETTLKYLKINVNIKLENLKFDFFFYRLGHLMRARDRLPPTILTVYVHVSGIVTRASSRAQARGPACRIGDLPTRSRSFLHSLSIAREKPTIRTRTHGRMIERAMKSTGWGRHRRVTPPRPFPYSTRGRQTSSIRADGCSRGGARLARSSVVPARGDGR